MRRVIVSRPTRLCYDNRLDANKFAGVIVSRPTRLCYDQGCDAGIAKLGHSFPSDTALL